MDSAKMKDVPTVVIENDGFRFALQLVDELPGGVEVCLQIRAGSRADLHDACHALRSAAIEGLLRANLTDFERLYPTDRPSRTRMRIPVRARVEIDGSAEEEVAKREEAARQEREREAARIRE